MRLIPLLVAALMVGRPIHAQEPPSSTGERVESPAEDDRSPGLPVSLGRIREALARVPDKPLRGLNEHPHFIVEVQQQLALERLFDSVDFSGGPTPAGGLYAYEQQRITGSTNRPLDRPYAAFTGGDLVQVALTSVLSRLLGPLLVGRLEDAAASSAAEAARAEVERDIADYCGRLPGGGTHLAICSTR